MAKEYANAEASTRTMSVTTQSLMSPAQAPTGRSAPRAPQGMEVETLIRTRRRNPTAGGDGVWMYVTST